MSNDVKKKFHFKSDEDLNEKDFWSQEAVVLLPAGKRRDLLADAAEKMFQEDFSGNCLPFDESCTAIYATVVANRRRSGFSMTTEDAQIAAITLHHNLPLATRNTKDFLHIDGLVLYNPWAPQ